jgi:hypothetical protein
MDADLPTVTRRLGMAMRYFARISQTGPVKYAQRQVPGSIGVLESLDNFMPIGEARRKTWDQNGLAFWTVHIMGQTIEARLVIIDREFKPAP